MIIFYLNIEMKLRGIGGIFFDDFTDNNFEYCFELITAIGNSLHQNLFTNCAKKKR